MARRKRQDIPDAGATMQIDSIADQLEDYEAADQLGAAPPPLPPRRGSKAMWAVGGVVVLLAGGLGLTAGIYLLREGASEVPPSAPVVEPATAADPSPPSEGADVLQMDEFVFGDEPAAGAPEPEAAPEGDGEGVAPEPPEAPGEP